MNKTARDPFSGEIIGEERATTLPTDSETESVIISTKNVTPILLLLVIASGVLSLFSYKPPIGAEEILIPILASLITVIVLGWFIVLFFRALSTIIRLLLDIKYLLTALTKR